MKIPGVAMKRDIDHEHEATFKTAELPRKRPSPPTGRDGMKRDIDQMIDNTIRCLEHNHEALSLHGIIRLAEVLRAWLLDGEQRSVDYDKFYTAQERVTDLCADLEEAYTQIARETA